MSETIQLISPQILQNNWPSINRGIIGRAAVVAAGLGSVLAAINQSPAIFGAEEIELLSLTLVFATPFAVVVMSQPLGIRQARQDAERDNSVAESFLTTARSHGIPIRAVLTGLFFGSFNSAIVLTVEFYANGNIGAVPFSLLGQSFSLPILFGLLSQTIAYRRASSIGVTPEC